MRDDDNDNLFRAYYKQFGKMAYAPSNCVEYYEKKGKSFARLSNCNGTLAIYEIKKDGYLRYAKEEMEEDGSA